MLVVFPFSLVKCFTFPYHFSLPLFYSVLPHSCIVFSHLSIPLLIIKRSFSVFFTILYLSLISAFILFEYSEGSCLLIFAITLLVLSQMLDSFDSIHYFLLNIQNWRNDFENCLYNLFLAGNFLMDVDFDMLFRYESLNIEDIVLINIVLDVL